MKPRQIEFARLNLTYTVVSKRRLIDLVEAGCVTGWDDPRMPTVAGMRRRGYTPEAIRDFCAKIGVAKNDSFVDIGLLEHCVRDDLNERAPRVMAVLHPLKLVIDNYPEDGVEDFDVPNHPQKPEMGSRKVPFSRHLYIEQDDFEENPPKKYRRLAPGREVRLRGSYVVKFASLVKDEKTGEVKEVHCTYDRETRDGPPLDGRKVEGVIHWVSAAHSIRANVRVYDRLFQIPDPAGAEGEVTTHLNPRSLETLLECRVEPSLEGALAGSRHQFERLGYFCLDPKDSSPGKLVFNRIVPLRDSWGKMMGHA
jgi:glutaminyl-tRNA synthetase